MAAKKNIDLLHTAISWGASVVIVGALFKILHLGGVWGNYMIGIGLGVEAFLFFITGFFPPPKDLPWTRIYPELSEDYDGDFRAPSPKQALTMSTTTGALDKMMADAKIGPDLIASLGTGLRSFADKVHSISNMADTSNATLEFAGKIQTATQKFDSLGMAFEKATGSLTEMGNTHVDAKAYHEQVNGMAKNLSALNAVYELELQDSSSHLKSMNKFYQNLSMTMQNFSESMEDSKMFKDEVGRLAKNLSSLNSIYGNMLSAMNQTRA